MWYNKINKDFKWNELVFFIVHFFKVFVTLFSFSLFSAEKVKDAILNKKSCDKIIQIYKYELYRDVGFTEPKAIEYLSRMHDELKKINLSDDILADFKERECAFYSCIQKINPAMDRCKFSEELEKSYFDFIARFLIDNHLYFSKQLFEVMNEKEGELPFFSAYTFLLEVSKDNIGKVENPYKKIHFVPTLICLKAQDQKLLLLTDDRHGSYSQFSTFLFDGVLIKKIVKMKHSFSAKAFPLHNRDYVFSDFTKSHVFSSWEARYYKDSPGFLYRWDAKKNKLSIIDQGVKNYVHNFELIGDVWHFVD